MTNTSGDDWTVTFSIPSGSVDFGTPISIVVAASDADNTSIEPTTNLFGEVVVFPCP